MAECFHIAKLFNRLIKKKSIQNKIKKNMTDIKKYSKKFNSVEFLLSIINYEISSLRILCFLSKKAKNHIYMLYWHEFEQTPEDGEGQASLVCPWGLQRVGHD